ncbi:MAG: 2-oxo acid dehydrogenase subunit E2 [Chloroflexi bacterium]|nr:2-oxo acid dehydrogenase subunit E2 [Chloroflexota bacterium]MCI0643293.1 2-oxo acid dehydrogenase subunit E2 [Chloroflexota bacterium]
MATKVVMPQLGESVIEGTIATWLKQEGDKVAKYEPILEIETDKVTTEATAEVAGTLLKILVPAGQTVSVGTVLAYIGEPGEAVGDGAPVTTPAEPAAASPATAPARKTPSTNGPSTAPPAARQYTGRISPVVGRIAEEHNVNLDLVPGTGRDGRITKKDILAYLEQRPQEPTIAEPTPTPLPVPPSPLPPRPPAPSAAPAELLPLTNIRRAIAEHMVRSKHTSPHVTTVFDVDFSAVAAHREAHKAAFTRDGANLTFTAYLVAATIQALKAHPLVNSTWTDEGILLRKEVNVGVAVAIPDGLIVPVIKNADSLNLLGLARMVNDLAERARNKQLKPDEVQGGTFSITNHGVSGSLFATPIINQPQCGILGVGKIEKRVKVINDAIAIRPMAYLSLTFDHRILDGASADGFMSTLKELLEEWH